MAETAVDIPMLSTVALLDNLPTQSLVRGQVGTVVEKLDPETALVEFSDDEGRAFAVAACPLGLLLPLRTTPMAA